ncbi:HotDog domain-containing protein [Chaetomium sp. MPI-SDFR-AT-0129]|nr:HotDog domain-containing protein [Chaetomium sp. MPI-SDFR-AT-0129]
MPSSPPSKPQKHASSFLDLTGEARVRELMDQFALTLNDPDDQEWTKTLFPHLKVVSVSPDGPHPSVTFSFVVQPVHCNRLGNLHGGCTASIFDFTTSIVLAIIAHPGYWSYLGVSRTLNTTYLRPAPVGGEVIIRCELVQVGQRLATLRGTMHRRREGGEGEGDGPLVAVCEHGKFNTDPGVSKA